MGLTPSQKIDYLEEKIPYEYFSALDRLIDDLYCLVVYKHNMKRIKEILAKLKDIADEVEEEWKR
ncbi:MAG: hypothetical protein J7J44_08785 [Deltaproteobacteria bacterium]|nr:hypothetical protein [Deltaproteobacteria bacterium]